MFTINNNNVSEAIAKSVDELVTSRIAAAPYDKTYAGIISEILFEPDTEIKNENFGMYKVRYGSAEKSFKLNDGIVHEVGERVMVYVPENNPNRMFAEPVIKRIVPYKIVYDNEKDAFTEYRKVKTNGKVYETKSIYKLTVKNKGTEEEEVTKMKLPDGREIEFEGWDM